MDLAVLFAGSMSAVASRKAASIALSRDIVSVVLVGAQGSVLKGRHIILHDSSQALLESLTWFISGCIPASVVIVSQNFVGPAEK